MLRTLTSLATSWKAHRLLHKEERLASMNEQTARQWASCLSIWLQQLPRLEMREHRAWTDNLYRHGEKIGIDADFWKALQHKLSLDHSNVDSALTGELVQAGLFNNPLPFIHFQKYVSPKKNLLGETQTVDGTIQYIRMTFNHGTHPGLGAKLALLGGDAFHDELMFMNLPVRSKDELFKPRQNSSENYWKFFYGEKEFPIECLVDYYTSMASMNPSQEAYASWTCAAWEARRSNAALKKDNHWEVFVAHVRPLFAPHVDWALIAACHGFVVDASSDQHTRNAHIAAYAREHFDKHPHDHAVVEQHDGTTLALLSVAEPSEPWEMYQLFTHAESPQTPQESYALDFDLN